MENIDYNMSNKLSELHAGVPKSAENGEIVIENGAQSPVLQDQLLKLRKFDDFVESLDKNGSQNKSTTAMTNGKVGNISLCSKESASEDEDKEGSSSFETSSGGGLEHIVIDPSEGGLGGLMGLVSISPAESPVRLKKNVTSSNAQTSSAQNLNSRTSESMTSEVGSSITSAKKSDNSSGFEDSFSVLVPPTSKPTSSVNESTDLSVFDPHAPVKSPPPVTRKRSWVQFDEDENDRLSTSSRGTSMSSSSVKYQGIPIPQSQFSPSVPRSGLIHSPAGSGFVKDWVKYGAQSPRFTPAANPNLVPQHTGKDAVSFNVAFLEKQNNTVYKCFW